MTRRVDWGEMRAPELRALAERNAIVILPVGSVEQHGPHLPTQVDTMLAAEVARRAALLIADQEPVVVAPAVWSGLADHHIALGGTITLNFADFHGLLRCICRSLGRQGFRRIFLLNGHGGNISALTVIVGELTQELKIPIGTATYWILAQEEFGRVLERQSTVWHACEAETSMLLALRPDLVDQEAMRTVTAATRGLDDPDGIHFWHSITDWTSTGVIGVPKEATADKGERLLSAAAGALARKLLSKSLWARGARARDRAE
jgi:creatinine amidohydrolase